MRLIHKKIMMVIIWYSLIILIYYEIGLFAAVMFYFCLSAIKFIVLSYKNNDKHENDM